MLVFWKKRRLEKNQFEIVWPLGIHYFLYLSVFTHNFWPQAMLLFFREHIFIVLQCLSFRQWKGLGHIPAVFLTVKVGIFLKCCLDLIPSPSVKIQIIGKKVCLRCKGKTLFGVVNKLSKTKKLLISLSNVLPYNFK